MTMLPNRMAGAGHPRARYAIANGWLHGRDLHPLLVHGNLFVVFTVAILNKAVATLDIASHLFGWMYEGAVHPIYPALFSFTVFNVLYAAHGANANLNVEVQRALAWLYRTCRWFLVFLTLLALQWFTLDDSTAEIRKSTGYLVALGWALSCSMLVSGRRDQFNKLLITYWVSAGILIAAVSILLYLVDYRPENGVWTAIDFNANQEPVGGWTGLPAMRGFLLPIETSVLVAISLTLALCFYGFRLASALWALAGICLLVLLAKRTGIAVLVLSLCAIWLASGIRSGWKKASAYWGILLVPAVLYATYIAILIVMVLNDCGVCSGAFSRAFWFPLLTDTAEHGLWFGFGHEHFTALVMQYASGHKSADNSFVMIFGTMGVVGLAVYVAFIVDIMKRLFGDYIETGTRLSLANSVLWVGMLAASMSGEWMNNVTVGFPLVLLLLVGVDFRPDRSCMAPAKC